MLAIVSLNLFLSNNSIVWIWIEHVSDEMTPIPVNTNGFEASDKVTVITYQPHGVSMIEKSGSIMYVDIQDDSAIVDANSCFVSGSTQCI